MPMKQYFFNMRQHSEVTVKKPTLTKCFGIISYFRHIDLRMEANLIILIHNAHNLTLKLINTIHKKRNFHFISTERLK